MDFKDRRVVVTGGAGFIGSHVVDQFVDAGSEIIVIDDFSTGDRSNLDRHDGDSAVRIQEADVRDQETVEDLVGGADLIVHMAVADLRASLHDPYGVHDVNATGTLSVCQAAMRRHVPRVVYVSSSEAYGSAAYTPMDEAHPLLPTTVYGASKAAGELYTLAHARTYHTEVVIVRPFNSYGPRGHAEGSSAEVIPKFAMRVLAGLPPVIFGTGEQTRDFTWVEDSARGILLAAGCDELLGEAVNIARGQEVSIARVSDLVLGALGRRDLEPVHMDDRPGDVHRHFADTTKARQVLGFAPAVDIEQGVKQYVSWLADQDLDIEAWARHERVRNW